jgi:hypothetical protein
MHFCNSSLRTCRRASVSSVPLFTFMFPCSDVLATYSKPGVKTSGNKWYCRPLLTGAVLLTHRCVTCAVDASLWKIVSYMSQIKVPWSGLRPSRLLLTWCSKLIFLLITISRQLTTDNDSGSPATQWTVDSVFLCYWPIGSALHNLMTPCQVCISDAVHWRHGSVWNFLWSHIFFRQYSALCQFWFFIDRYLVNF